MKFKTITLLVLIVGMVNPGAVLAQNFDAVPLRTASGQAKFAPDQIIVLFEEGQTPVELEEVADRRREKRSALLGKTQIYFEDLIGKLQGEITVEEKIARLAEVRQKYFLKEEVRLFSGIQKPETTPGLNRFYLYKAAEAFPVDTVMAGFSALPFVENTQPNYIWRASYLQPSDPYFVYQWPLAKLQVLSGWDKTRGSGAVTAAIIDSGLDYNHADFAGRSLVYGYDFTTCNLFSDTGNCLSPKSRDADPMDNFGHGTMVTGITAAATNNAVGIAALDWYLKIMPLKAMVETGGYLSDVTDAIIHAVDYGAKVINLSLGGEGSCLANSVEQAAINYAYSRGVTVVAAAGNENTNAAYSSPAGCQHVVAVAATGADDARAPYSNYGAVVDLAAPGGNPDPCGSFPSQECMAANYILSPGLSPDYYFAVGTSFAAPHVTGAIALLLALNPALTPDQVEARIKAGVDPAQTTADKPIGTGRINVDKVLSAVASTPTPTRSPTPTPTTAVNITLSGKTYCLVQTSGTKVYRSGIPIRLFSPDATTVVATSGTNGDWSATHTKSFWEGPTSKALRPNGGADFPCASNSTTCPGITCTDSNLEGIAFDAANDIYEVGGCARGVADTSLTNSTVSFNLGYCPTPTPTPTTTPVTKIADVNLDGLVNLADFRLVLRAWGTAGTLTYNYREDILKDGKVNAQDIAAVISGWKK